jgi:hypothetical protein
MTLRRSLNDLLKQWEHEMAGLQNTATQAAGHGYAEIAAIFARQVLRLKKRIEAMRSSLQAASAEDYAQL